VRGSARTGYPSIGECAQAPARGGKGAWAPNQGTVTQPWPGGL